jgi:hypothetical protein
MAEGLEESWRRNLTLLLNKMQMILSRSICSSNPSCLFFTSLESFTCSTSPSCPFFNSQQAPAVTTSLLETRSRSPQLAEVLHLAASRGCLSSGVSAQVTNSPSDKA